MSNEYEVGRGKPPQDTQFKPGRSGNPKGRPKGTSNLKTDVKKTLKKPVKVTIDGKSTKVSTQEASLMRLREQALKGDAKAIDRLLALAQIHNNEEPVEETKPLGADDAAILESYKARLLRRLSKGLEVVPPEPAGANLTGDALSAAIEEARWRRCIGDPPEPGDAELLAKFDNERVSL
jgi:hypothetical protein